MIYLHCGWPKTGTTSLQAAIVKHQRGLADTGIAYPDDWRPDGADAHYGLAEVLRAARRGDAGFGMFEEWLCEYSGDDVVLSSEGLTNWLLKEEKFEVLLQFVRAAQSVAPVRCVWTLRRFDAMVHSAFVHFTLQRTV
jgi:hypothetical protein